MAWCKSGTGLISLYEIDNCLFSFDQRYSLSVLNCLVSSHIDVDPSSISFNVCKGFRASLRSSHRFGSYKQPGGPNGSISGVLRES